MAERATVKGAPMRRRRTPEQRLERLDVRRAGSNTFGGPGHSPSAADLKEHNEGDALLAKRAEAEKAERADAVAKRQAEGKRRQEAYLVLDVVMRLAKGESLGKGQRKVYARHKAAIAGRVTAMKAVFAAGARRRSDPAK